MKTCYIVGGGECDKLDFHKDEDDIIVAADAGYKYLMDRKLEADYVIGDFDSMEEVDHKNKIKLNVDKDETDMEMAVRLAVSQGFKRIIIYGSLGGERLDHTFANIQMASHYAREGIKIELIGNTQKVVFLHNDSYVIPKGSYEKKTFISIFSVDGDSLGVSIKGLKYELSNATLTSGFSRGVSNELLDGDAEISVLDGNLVIVISKDSSIGR